MGIYEASFLGEPKPIKEKKIRKKADPAPAPEPVEVAPVEPKPKPVRKRKDPEPEVPVVLQVPVKKVKPQKPEPIPELPIPTVKPIRAKKVIVSGVEAEEAPAWFKAHMHAEAKRRNDKKPKAEKITAPVLKAETEAATSAKWNDGVTKEKVTREVDSHMDRLYKQIHGRK